VTAPMIVAGTTGDEGRIFCQFWGEWKTPARDIRMVDYAHMDNRTDGLRVKADCPTEWLPTVWAAYLEVISGIVPTSTHTITFEFNANNPTLTPIDPPEADNDQLTFDLEGINP